MSWEGERERGMTCFVLNFIIGCAGRGLAAISGFAGDTAWHLIGSVVDRSII